METDRLSYLLHHEATAHGKEDYKHLAADALESLSAEVECLRAELAELRRFRKAIMDYDSNLYDALANSDAAHKGEEA